jgi:hypothetical protein
MIARRPSAFALMAMTMAVGAGFGLAPARIDPMPSMPNPEPARTPRHDPNGPAPWLSSTLPPLPEQSTPEPKRHRRSLAERKQRREKRKQRGKK